MWSHKQCRRHFLTYLRNARTYLNETRHSQLLITGRHDTDDICRVLDLKVRVTEHFPEMHFSGGGVPINQSAVEDHLVTNVFHSVVITVNVCSQIQTCPNICF